MKLELTKGEAEFLDDYFTKILKVANREFEMIEEEYMKDYAFLVTNMASIKIKLSVLLEDIDNGEGEQMNRQTKRRIFRNLNISEKELDYLANYFKEENDLQNQELVQMFLALTIEALRVEFGFGQKRVDRYTKRLDSLLDSVNLGYLSFDDVMDQISLKPMGVVKMSPEVREEKLKEIAEKKKKAKASQR